MNKWTWLDELVHNLLALIIVVPTVAVLVASAFDPEVSVPPELMAGSLAVLTAYGYKSIKNGKGAVTAPTPAKVEEVKTNGSTTP